MRTMRSLVFFVLAGLPTPSEPRAETSCPDLPVARRVSYEGQERILLRLIERVVRSSAVEPPSNADVVRSFARCWAIRRRPVARQGQEAAASESEEVYPFRLA